uniref:Ribosomal protein S3 n=1 Tax=Lecanora cinereofusca TaxID=1518593 RepID=A0A482JW73_9LECA|nr:ribosomal protein S3 [Lecanora cinereofusca]QBP39494.1 ribosomal protein S3 [Lecanora cinereofusca]
MNKKIKRLLEINNVNCQRSNSTNSTFSLNLFNIKSKKHYKPKTGINETEVNKNFVGKPKYYPPAHVEWFNSIYAYNRNTIKLLPTALKDTFKLVKSYFNFYSQKLEKKVRFTRIRNRVRRLSTNRILISKPELKHTSDKVIVIIYAYNRQKKYYLNKMKRVASIDNIDSILPDDVKEVLIELNGPWPSNLKLQTLTKKILMIRSKVKKHQDIALKTLVKKVCYNKFDNHKTKDSKDRTAVYAEIYNRKRKLQNIKMDDIISDSLDIQVNDSSKVELQNEDILELSLSKIGSSEFLTKLKDYRSCLTSNDTCLNYPLFMANTIIKLIKHKYVSGIRIQAAGRLTRRNTAARSVFKLRYKGNIKNMDSSYKGLPSVLLRGYAKSNLQFSKSKSRIRIGSFGLKGWVSS